MKTHLGLKMEDDLKNKFKNGRQPQKKMIKMEDKLRKK
jgi:hypothetical protein